MRAPIGLRIRNHRQVKGLTQASLAKSASISASYLNLIEANKRDVGGVLLHKLAAALEIELSELTGESELRLISEMQEAFSDPALESLKLGPKDAHTLVARQPQLAQALHRLYRALLDMRDQTHAFSNRLQSDPLFSKLLHQMLSQITAVRSAAEILRDVPDLAEKNRKSFHLTINEESLALTSAARSLIAEFDIESERHRSLSPAREVDDLLIEQDNYFPELEDAASRLRTRIIGAESYLQTRRLVAELESQHALSVMYEGPPKSIEQETRKDHGYSKADNAIWFRPGVPMATQRFALARQVAVMSEAKLIESILEDPRLTSQQARSLAFHALSSYLAGAILFPYDDFLATAQASRYDIDFLSQKYVASFEQIAHRLVTLRAPDNAGIPFGFIRADPSGFLSKQFPLPGLLLPNAGHACPLWPLSAAYRSMNSIVRQMVGFSDGARFLFIAKASAKRVSAYTEPPVYSSVMLATDVLHASDTIYGAGLNLGDTANDVPVGPSCRLCVRTQCPQRQETVAQNVLPSN